MVFRFPPGSIFVVFLHMAIDHQPEKFRASLLNWFNENARPISWRQSRDAYRVWLSEIIMQQTRVEQGTPYFERMIAAYPTVHHLANAPEDEVLRHWQGLGYYTRARNLHAAAKEVAETYKGNFPVEYEKIIRLKGIGEYTAAAILSIAFGQVYPAVDGNVMRVLSRVYAEGTPLNSPAAKKVFTELASELIDPRQPGKFNEALMELGATVCIPRNPRCSECPLNSFCLAYELNQQDRYPVKLPKQKNKKVHLHYFVVRKGKELLVKKRDALSIWKNLYDFPLIEKDKAGKPNATEIKELLGIDANRLKACYRMKHVLSHRDLDIQFYALETKIYHTPAGYQWVTYEEAMKLPVPKPIEIFLSQYVSNPYFV